MLPAVSSVSFQTLRSQMVREDFSVIRERRRREEQALTVTCPLACGSLGWNGCFRMIFWHSFSDIPQIHIHMQSKNLSLIINLAGPKGASAVVRKSQSGAWVEPSVRGMYLVLSLMLSPVLFPTQVVCTLVLVFAAWFAVGLLCSKRKNRGMLPACFQDVVKVGRSSPALYVVCWLVCMSSRLRMIFSLPHSVANVRLALLLGDFCAPGQRNEVRKKQPCARCIWRYDAIPRWI